MPIHHADDQQRNRLQQVSYIGATADNAQFWLQLICEALRGKGGTMVMQMRSVSEGHSKQLHLSMAPYLVLGAVIVMSV